MSADVTLPADTARPVRRRTATFGLSWRILGLVIVAVMTAEIAIFLPSIARFRLVYLEQLIESGTLAALALDATPDNMVTEQVKGSLLTHARVEAVVLVEPNKPKRALMNIEPRPEMPGFNLKDRGALGLIWDALDAMVRDGPPYIRVGGESMRMPGAMVWIVVDERPMRAAMYGYTSRILILSIIIALFTAGLLYLALRWLVIRPLQDLSRAMIDFRRAPEEADTDRAPVRRNDEIGVVDREFQILQRELRTSLRQKSRLAEVGAATNKINHDLRNMLSTARLLSDRLARSDDERTRALAPTILNTIDRAARLASDAIEYVREKPSPGWPKSILPTSSTRSESHCRSRERNGIPTSCAAGSTRSVRAAWCAATATCSTGCSSIWGATPSKPARRASPYAPGAAVASCWSRSPTTGPACLPRWPDSCSGPSPPAAARAARASASRSPATWCACMAATSP